MLKKFSKRVLANLAAKIYSVPTIEGYAKHALNLFFDQHGITESNLECYKIDRCAPPLDHLFERVYAGKAKRNGRLIGLVILYDEDTGYITGTSFSPNQSHLHMSVYRSYKQKHERGSLETFDSLYFEMCHNFGERLDDLIFEKYEDEKKGHLEPNSSQRKLISRSHERPTAVTRNIPAINSAPISNLEKHNNRITQFVQSNTPEKIKQSATAASKYADFKRSNRRSAEQQKKSQPELKNEHSFSIKNTAPQPELSDEEQSKKFAWLEDNAKYFLRIQSEGRTLTEYQEGIIEKYEQWLVEKPKLKDDQC